MSDERTVRIYVEDPDFTLYVGDVREVLPSLPAESIDCALTSPPFYALRDYGVEKWHLLLKRKVV